MTPPDTASVRPFPAMDTATPAQAIHTLPESPTIRDCVANAVRCYFQTLDGHDDITHLYDMVLAEMEAPLLQAVLEHTRGNQSQAAAILGLNRGTLRKKMKTYQLL